MDGEDCDRFYLFLAVRGGQFYRFDRAKGESITKNGRDAGEKSRSNRTRLDFDLAWRASVPQLGRVLFPAAIAQDQLFLRTSGSQFVANLLAYAEVEVVDLAATLEQDRILRVRDQYRRSEASPAGSR